MKFEHKIEVPAEASAVREFLDDVQSAARCIPGVEDVKDLGDGLYEGTARLKLGPLGFTIAGKARLDHADDGSWRLEGEGRDARVGAGVKAQVEAHLSTLAPQSTEVALLADIQFSGRLAEMGQPLIKRKADSMVKEFAENLRKAFQPAG